MSGHDFPPARPLPASQPLGLTFHAMTDAMFEPANWRRFKSFVVRVRERAAESGRPDVSRFSMTDAGEGGGGPMRAGRSVFF